MIKSIAALMLTIVGVGGLLACSSAASPTSSSEIEAIRVWADPATEMTLKGLSENDLAKYIELGDTQFKAAVTQEGLDQAYNQINGQLGSFVSVTFLRTEEKDGYTIVHYKAEYARGEVGVRMVFNADHKVSGQWFE